MSVEITQIIEPDPDKKTGIYENNGSPVDRTRTIVDDRAITAEHEFPTREYELAVTAVHETSRTGVHHNAITRAMIAPTQNMVVRGVAKTLAMTLPDHEQETDETAKYLLNDFGQISDKKAKSVLWEWFLEYQQNPRAPGIKQKLVDLLYSKLSPQNSTDRKIYHRLQRKAILWLE